MYSVCYRNASDLFSVVPRLRPGAPVRFIYKPSASITTTSKTELVHKYSKHYKNLISIAILPVTLYRRQARKDMTRDVFTLQDDLLQNMNDLYRLKNTMQRILK